MLFRFISWYCEAGVQIFLISLIFAYFRTQSLPDALQQEAVRCGLSPEVAASNPTWRNGLQALIAWPIGAVNALISLFR